MSGDAFYDGLGEETPVQKAGAALAGVLAGPQAQPGEAIEPVYLEHTLVCSFKAKPCALCGKPPGSKVHRPKKTATCPFKRQNGCATCGKAKNDPDHVGAPESFNIFASGGWEAYQSAKQRWHKVLMPLLLASGLPRGLGGVLVEGECSFGDDRERDQGNHRVVIEKALGDVLQEGEWLSKDKWDVYEFGNLTLNEEGVNRIRLTLFPRPPDADPDDAQIALLPGD